MPSLPLSASPAVKCDEKHPDRDETHIVKKSFNVSTDEIGLLCLYLQSWKVALSIWKMIYYFISLRSRPLYSLMEKVLIQIDWVPHNFGAAPLNENIACVATGTTLEEVEKNIVEALRFHIEGMMVDGKTLPEELASPWEPEFCLTTRALLKYTGSYITQKALAKETGIAEQQLSHYANGLRHPRPAMQQKIVKGIQSICKHLTVVL